jgi:ZIP family zinc transporter
MTWIAIPLSLVAVAATFVGGMAALRLRTHLEALIALSGGVVVAVALFDVLPEAIDQVHSSRRLSLLVGLGFLAFFLAERLLHLHEHVDPHENEHDHAHEEDGPSRLGPLGAAALSAHSFVDGLGIGLAFSVNSATGLLVFLAVISHDFTDGLNTVGFILRNRGSRRHALAWLWVDAIAPFAGAIAGTTLALSDSSLGPLLALYVGFFLFMGATHLLPAAHSHSSRGRVALTTGGFLFTLLVVTLAAH